MFRFPFYERLAPRAKVNGPALDLQAASNIHAEGFKAERIPVIYIMGFLFIGLNMLMKRAFKFKDPFLLKMLRNISQHDELEIKMKFVVSLDNLPINNILRSIYMIIIINMCCMSMTFGVRGQ